MGARTPSVIGWIVVAAAVLLAGGVLVGAGFRYWSALPAEVPPALEASTVAALAALALGVVLLIQLQRSRAELEAIDPWAIVAVAALAGVLAGLMNGPLPNNVRAFRGSVHLDLKSPIKAKFDTDATVYCETVPGTERVAWLSATSMNPVETPEPETLAPDTLAPDTPAPDTPAPEASEAPDLKLPALNLYLAIRGERPVGISIAASPSVEPMTGNGASLEIVAGDRSGRATFSSLYTDEAWAGGSDGGYLTGSVRWDCLDRLPDSANETGG